MWVKVVSKTGQRLGLAMRDVDQVTGVDQLPMQRGGPSADGRSNPSGPTGANSQSALHGLSGIKVRRGCGCCCCTWRPRAETACICSEGQARVLFVKLHLNPFTRSCASLPCLPLLRSGPLLLLPAGC